MAENPAKGIREQAFGFRVGKGTDQDK